MGSLHKILVPVDGSPPALAALEHAVALAIDCDATVDLLHVEAADTFQIGSTTPLSPEAREAAWRLSAVTCRFWPSPTRSSAKARRCRVGRNPAEASQAVPR